MQITPQHQDLLAAIRPLVIPWRKMTIAVDGFDHSGKSTLARFLAWQLGMPAIETDLALLPDCSFTSHDYRLLKRLIESRHTFERPAIIEGVFVLRTLKELELHPEVLIRVEAAGRNGSYSWEAQFQDYLDNFQRANTPDFLFSWVPNDDG